MRKTVAFSLLLALAPLLAMPAAAAGRHDPPAATAAVELAPAAPVALEACPPSVTPDASIAAEPARFCSPAIAALQLTSSDRALERLTTNRTRMSASTLSARQQARGPSLTRQPAASRSGPAS